MRSYSTKILRAVAEARITPEALSYLRNIVPEQTWLIREWVDGPDPVLGRLEAA